MIGRYTGEGVTVTGKVTVLAASVKALLCQIPATRSTSAREVWVPHSVIHERSQVTDFDHNREGTLVVARWFHAKEGLP
jgi:hypothetical protein